MFILPICIIIHVHIFVAHLVYGAATAILYTHPIDIYNTYMYKYRIVCAVFFKLKSKVFITSFTSAHNIN